METSVLVALLGLIGTICAAVGAVIAAYLHKANKDVSPVPAPATQQEKDVAGTPVKAMLRVCTQQILGPKGRVVYLPYSASMQVASFLEEIWRAMSPIVKPYTYGKVWVLRESTTNRVLDVGSSWARSNGVESDHRTLSEAGIMPGMQLEVVPLGKL